MGKAASEQLGLERIVYTREEGAAVLGINHGTFGKLIRSGMVPHLQLPGCHVLIGKRALDQWVTEQCLSAVRSPAGAGPTLTDEADAMPPVRRLRRRSGAA